MNIHVYALSASVRILCCTHFMLANTQFAVLRIHWLPTDITNFNYITFSMLLQNPYVNNKYFIDTERT